MKSIEIPTTDPRELLDQMANLVGDQERRQFFDRRPELVEARQVEELCSEVARQVSIDAERAIELAATARFVAEMVADDRVRALSARAAANAYHFSGDAELAQEFYEQALLLYESQGDAVAVAVTKSSALHNLAYLGRYDQVYEWERSARAAFETVGDRLRLAILDHNLAIVLGRQDKHQEELEHYQRAYREFEALDRHQDAAICLRNVAVCHVHLHHFREALEIYEQSRAFCEAQGLSRLVIEIDYNTAYLHHLRGEYTRSIQLYRLARREAKAAGDDYHRALCDLGLVEIYLELNLTEEAMELARSAYRSFDRLKIPYETAQALTNRALAVSSRGQGELALRLLRQARKIFVREENHLWPALIDFYSAVVLTRDGRTEEAVELTERALATFASSEAESRAILCELLLARLQLDLGRVDQGRRTCGEALRRLEDLELPALEHRAYMVLGQVEEQAGDPVRALAAYRRSHEWLEELRSQLHGDDLKIAFSKDKQAVYESLVWLILGEERTQRAARSGTRDAGARHTQAFEFIEKAKSRSLADLMAFRAHTLKPRDADRSDLAARVRELREELNWYYRQIDLQQMKEGEKVREELARLRADARKTESRLLSAQSELRASDLELSSIQTGSMVELDAVRSSIPEGSVLLEYFIARGEVFAAVVGRDHLEVRWVATARRARELHRLLQFQLARTARLSVGVQGRTGLADLASRATAAHLGELHQELLEPLLGLLGDRDLIVAPHGFLHYVPFHALLDADGKALVEGRAISYAPSASVFHLCATKQVDFEERSLVLGVADERAPHILAESKAVAETLPGAKLLLGEEATEESLRTLGHGCRYLHIATHGLFRRDNPMFSAIQLGRSRLALFDLYNLRLDAELVVLSGCGTGLNAVLGADELLGLTRGLLYAGAQSLLVTLWDVHDESTAGFMRRFYARLGRGEGRVQALRQAMLEHREEYPEPYYWAPFVLVGEPV